MQCWGPALYMIQLVKSHLIYMRDNSGPALNPMPHCKLAAWNHLQWMRLWDHVRGRAHSRGLWNEETIVSRAITRSANSKGANEACAWWTSGGEPFWGLHLVASIAKKQDIERARDPIEKIWLTGNSIATNVYYARIFVFWQISCRSDCRDNITYQSRCYCQMSNSNVVWLPSPLTMTKGPIRISANTFTR